MDACERLSKYLATFKESLKSLKLIDTSSSRIVDLALSYFNDSKYYFEKGDCITGLVTISYAEGILDALKLLNMIEWHWQKPIERIVLAAGSFDIIHPGHIEFLKWASSLGSKLYVIVSRDENYKRFKGFNPVFKESERLCIVSSLRYIYRALLGSIENILKSVEEIKPDVIALGYDQLLDINFDKEIRIKGLNAKVIRMDSRIGSYSSSNIKDRICSEWCR
ncbi:MAG: DUF357 domain-containing protein [Ignisphaera sp.]|uniref:Cytidylyltransferase family protein n=1 Tax=Ignisphaera aggregans TaxID=334771 RepID=A0A7J3JPS2_9CREN